jgi:hypothetical protein
MTVFNYPIKSVLLLLMLCIAPVVALAQADCPEIVQTALDSADQFCAATGRNQACYGHFALTAEPQPEVENFTFADSGDIVDVAAVQSMRLNPLDEASGQWGVALMNLQANLPDTLPGQNVTFLLFGDVELTNAVSADDPATAELRPMQAFYLRTGVGDAGCAEAPESGMLVQTPEGSSSVVFNVNGVDVEMGSTIFFQSNPEDGMTVSTLEGAASVSTENGSQSILPGTWVRIPIDDDLRPTDPPGLPLSYVRRSEMLDSLPLRLLQRDIEIAPALDEGELERLQTRILTGEPICGEEGLPSCSDYPFLTGERQCLLLAGPLCGPRRPGRPNG